MSLASVGCPVEMPCPQGLAWNDKVKRCDWENEFSKCGVPCGQNLDDDETAEDDLPWCKPPVCKEPYGLMPNPGNCSTFY